MLICPGCNEENPPKFRLCGYCGTPLPGAAAPLPVHEVRKTVTIVFCDLQGSTALGERLDAEALHEVKERYFSAMAAEITRHGGKIEKYIGDAIMAVFGLPRAHEDDALRAVRAAAAMGTALVQVNRVLGLQHGVTLVQRIGVNTGEVVANDAPGADQKLATGDAVNVAARLEQAAQPDTVYLGDLTYRLVRDAVDAEAVASLELKGKAQAVPAWRLRAVRGLEGNLRRSDTPMVGRESELAALQTAYAEVCRSGSMRLVTVVGDAGMGKSRLVLEVVQGIAVGARVLRGRCLPYGDSITFWPVRSMLSEAAGINDDDTPQAAQAKLLAMLGHADAAARLATVAGLADTPFPTDELHWAVKKFFQTLAEQGPLVLVVDDLHWAEPALLELIEKLLQSRTASPILLLGTARHELLERHPQWSQGDNALRLVLAPLSDAAAGQVVAHLLGAANWPQDVVARIVQAAEGNPLYVEQVLSMLVDNGQLRQEGGQWVSTGALADIAVPPTIQALLEARLDTLARSERAAVEPASVIGLEFARSAVQSLAPLAMREGIDEQLGSLARKQFVQASHSAAAEVVYRFHHHLVRETVYGGLLKRERAHLHAEFVRWADRVNADRDRALEYEEILGYHLEQAHRYLSELGPLDAAGQALGQDACARLARCGKRAFARGDMGAAASLLRRAVAIARPGDAARHALLPELGEALTELGRFDEARLVLAECTEAPADQHDPSVQADAKLVGMLLRLYSGEQDGWSEETLRLTSELIPQLEVQQADDVLATAWRLVGFVHGIAGAYAQNGPAVAKSLHHARRAGNARIAARAAMALATSAFFGPTPVPQAIAQCERIVAEGLGNRQIESMISCTLAQLLAMNGEFDKARALMQQARSVLRDMGPGVSVAASGLKLLQLELLAGDLARAETEVRPDYEFLTRSGETFYLSSMAAVLAVVVREQGRDDEALALALTAQQAAAPDDVDAQVLWRLARAPLLARRGELDPAETLAREALAWAEKTEVPTLRADAWRELAVVLRVTGQHAQALAAMAQAQEIYGLKGDVVSLERASAWVAQQPLL